MLIYFSDVQQKLGKLINFYEGIKDTTHFRTQSLENTLDVSERFWDDLHSLASTIKDLQDAITQQDPPALEPAVIREQQDYLEVCSVNLRLDLEVCSVNLRLDLEVCSVNWRLDLNHLINHIFCGQFTLSSMVLYSTFHFAKQIYRGSRDRMVVGFSCELEPCSW